MANDSKKYVSLTRLSNFLDNIKTKYSQIGHKHTIADLTDYKVDTALSSTSANPVQNKVIDAEFEAVSTAMGALDLAIDGKADASHTHDDRYYTESEIDTKLASKANSSHNHDSAYDAKGSASDVQENLDVVSDALDAHTANSNIHFTAAERTKLSGIAAGAQVNTVTGVKGSSESTYRTGNINITKANIGLGNVDNTADANKSVKHATSADSATSATKATQDGNGKVISSTYETKSDASAKLTEAKTYADNAASAVKNDLLNGAGAAYDTLKELGDLIDDNTDAISALETVAAGKADKTHSHAISDVSGLQTALDGKAASSHGTHVSYSTTAPVMDGTASVGSASTVARSDHKHPTDTSRAAKTDLDSHTGNTTIHITSTERTNWNAAKTHADSAHAPSNAQANQNAFSNIKVGSTTIAADTTTDTLELVGSNVTITPDTTNDKVTISVASGSTSTAGILKLTNSTSSTSTTTAATPNSVKSAYDLANTAKTNAATAQTRADSAYALAESKVDSLSDLGVTATATELNYVDGVTSNVQTQLDGKAGKKVEGQTITVGDVAYVGGVNAEIFNDYEANIATGAYSHAEGCYNKASGDYSHAEGAATISSGYAGHAEGYQTNASGSASHAEGKNTAAIGQCTHAEGSGSTAVPNTITSSSSISTVETAWNSAKFTLARGTGSHAEGGNTLALNTADHSEGYETIAKGGYSHAQGYKTQATGGRAHAEGQGSKASGNDSHAEGTYTIAAGASQHAQGKYNVEDTAGKYAHIVGGGSSTSKRANIHTLDWDGNAWFEGDVYIGGTSQDDTAASKVVTESSISTHVSNAVSNLENLAYISDEDQEDATATINADTLGGRPANEYVLKSEIGDMDISGSGGGSGVGGGASVQFDWNQTDETAADFIKNKPFGEFPTGGDTLEWDGNTDGLLSVMDALHKVSDATPTYDDFANGAEIVFNGTVVFIAVEDIYNFTDVILISDCAAIVHAACFDLEGLVFPEKGTYLYGGDGSFIESLTIPGYTGFPVTKKIEQKYLPGAVILYGDGTYLYNTEDISDASNRTSYIELKESVQSGRTIYICVAGIVHFLATSIELAGDFGIIITEDGELYTAEYTP